MAKNDLIKQEINFLENPLWFQDSHEAELTESGFIWQDKEGFVYRAGYKPPVKVDMVFLLYLLLQSQENDWNETIQISRYELLRSCGVGTSTYWYNRLEDSLKRWKMVGIEFEGTFYDGKEYKFMNFGIIDSWEIQKGSKKLEVTFSSKWLGKIKISKYFKMLDFQSVKELRSPLATRLHEILLKSFQGRNEWSIGAKKLAAKIPMKEQYPADIIPKIKTAVGRINEKTKLQIKLTVRRPKRGKAILAFEKLDKEPEAQEAKETPQQPEIIDVPPDQVESLHALIELMPEKEQGKKTLRELLARKLRKYGPDFVRRNILYANKNCKTNYRTYLNKSLKEDWGQGHEEDLRQQEEAKQAAQATKEREQQETLTELRIEQQALELLASMTTEQRQQLEEEARAALDAINPAMLQSPLASTLLKAKMNAILVTQIKQIIEPSYL